jgi:hypothetical protein
MEILCKGRILSYLFTCVINLRVLVEILPPISLSPSGI